MAELTLKDAEHRLRVWLESNPQYKEDGDDFERYFGAGLDVYLLRGHTVEVSGNMVRGVGTWQNCQGSGERELFTLQVANPAEVAACLQSAKWSNPLSLA